MVLTNSLEEEVQDSALLNIFRTLPVIRDWGTLQDIVYLSQQTGAMKQTFDFDAPHARVMEYTSRAVTYTLDRLEDCRKIRYVQTGHGTTNLHLDNSEARDPVDVNVGIVKTIGRLKPETIGMIKRVAFFAEEFNIDFAKSRLTKKEIARLRGVTVYPENWIREIHTAYRRILASRD